MFLAPSIFNKIVVSYKDKHHIDSFAMINGDVLYQDITREKTVQPRDINNIQSEYHKWIQSGAKNYSRETIIEKMKKGGTFNNKGEKRKPKPGKIYAGRFAEVKAESSSDESNEVHDESSSDESSDHSPKKTTRTNTRRNTRRNTRTETKEDPSHPTTINETTINTTPDHETSLFTWLNTLNWRDKDEQHMSETKFRNIKKSTLHKYYDIMLRMADDLYNTIETQTGALSSMSRKDRYNLLFHIMGKGEQFYLMTITDPMMSLYLIPDQYQPFYTYMKNVLGL